MATTEANLVKAPYKRQAFTAEQLDEFLKCADPVTGPEYFMDHFFYIQHPTKGKIPFEAYPFQKDLSLIHI